MQIIFSNGYNTPKVEVSIPKVYGWLTRAELNKSEDIDLEVKTYIIAWLPNITKLEVFIGCDNDFIDVYFNNEDYVRLYNTGLESELIELIEEA